MTFLELVRQRQSCRTYQTTPVDPEQLQRCLEAARLAPSACNSQPWHFIVIEQPQLREEVARATFDKLVSFNHFVLQAPLLVAIVAEPPNLTAQIGSLVKRKPLHHFDIGIAAAHLCLQAEAEGLGSCILGWFDEARIKKLLQIPRSKQVALIITLGHPASLELQPKLRKEPKEIISYNQY